MSARPVCQDGGRGRQCLPLAAHGRRPGAAGAGARGVRRPRRRPGADRRPPAPHGRAGAGRSRADAGRPARPGDREVRRGRRADVLHPRRAGAGHPGPGRGAPGRPGGAGRPGLRARRRLRHRGRPPRAGACRPDRGRGGQRRAAGGGGAGEPRRARPRRGGPAAEAEDLDLAGFGLVFADPARRNARGRVFDVDGWSPPWPFVLSLLARPSVVKVAPGIPHSLVPDGVEAEWVSDDGDVKEAGLWSPAARHGATPRHGGPGRRAGDADRRGPDGVRGPAGGAVPLRARRSRHPGRAGRPRSRPGSAAAWSTSTSPTSPATRRSPPRSRGRTRCSRSCPTRRRRCGPP